MKKVLVFLFFSFGWPVSVMAQKEFTISLENTYRYTDQGVSTIEQKITLTNQTQYQYADRYEMEIVGEEPESFKAWDNLGIMKFDNQQNKFTVYFNDPVVGKDKAYQFHTSFKGKPAIHNGQVWEVNFPKIINPDKIDDYQLKIIVPRSFGKLAFVSPQPVTSTGEVLIFTKDQGAHLGVVAAFGDFQTFRFKLDYDLANPTSETQIQRIAIPADTSYQRVFYDSLNPLPVQVEIDTDGNWIAEYRLNPNQVLRVEAVGQANVLADSTHVMPKVSYADLAIYVKPTHYWPATDPGFIKLAESYKTPKQIYDYVVATLNYDYTQIGKNTRRLGGLGALKNPDQSICSEFTDLFITMSRAANIPSREVNGFAYTTDFNQRPRTLGLDVLHAWPEYWDYAKSSWVSVDPTWGKTTKGIEYFSKFDLNHLAFVSRGVADDKPLAAGFYKLENSNTKNVDVSFGNYKDYPKKKLEINLDWPSQIFPPFGAAASLRIKNPNGFAIYQIHDQVPILPAFAEIKIPIKINPSKNFILFGQEVTVGVEGRALAYNVPTVKYLLWHVTLALITALTLLTVGFVATRAWSVYLQRQK